ncbi:MAG: hypothetical protein AAGD35_22900 [Actinomycetota bacterium]
MTITQSQHALRGAPAELAAAAESVSTAQAAGEAWAIRLTHLVDGYTSANEGPDIAAVVEAARSIGSTMTSLANAYADVEAALRRGVDRLTDLESRSLTLWNDAQALEPDPITVELDTVAVGALERRFHQIRSEEDQLYRDLAGQLNDVSPGEAPELNHGTIADVIGRAALHVEGSREMLELATALALLEDYGDDGEFNQLDRLQALHAQEFRVLLGEEVGQGELQTVSELRSDADPVFLAGVLRALRDPGTDFDDADAVLDATVSALQGGAHPDDAGLPPSLFPPAYLELLELNAEEHGPLRRDLDDASGWVAVPDWLDPTDNGQARAEAEAALDANRAAQAELMAELGIDGDDNFTMTLGAAMVALMGPSGTQTMWVRRFGRDMSLDEASTRTDGIDRIAPIIAGSEENSVAFYNELGTVNTALLVGTYARGTRPTYELLADALGDAAASGELSFTGTDLAQESRIGQPRTGNNNRLQGSPLQLLLLSDRIPDDFLIDATAEAFKLTAGPETRRQFYGSSLAGRGPYTELSAQHGFTHVGMGGDDINLVLIAEIERRDDPNLTMDLLNTIGIDNADVLLRYDAGVGQPPESWDPDHNHSPLTRILWDVANPAHTGDPELSDKAALWLLDGAGTPDDGFDLGLRGDTASAVELVILDRPTVMISSNFSDVALANGGIAERDPFDALFHEAHPPYNLDDDGKQLPTSDDVIDNALEGIFRSGGAGDLLLTLENGLIPAAVLDALEHGGGDPSVIGDLAWRGEIDGRIDGAAERAELAAAKSLDERNELIHSALGTTLELAVGGPLPSSLVVDGVVDQGVGLALDYAGGQGIGVADTQYRFFPTDNAQSVLEGLWDEEKVEDIHHEMAMINTLEAAGAVDLSGIDVERYRHHPDYTYLEPYFKTVDELTADDGTVDDGDRDEVDQALSSARQLVLIINRSDTATSEIPLLDDKGQPILDGNGDEIRLSDWLDAMNEYNNAANAAEKGY